MPIKDLLQPFRPGPGLVTAAALLFLVPNFFTRDPWSPDEPRYVEIARQVRKQANPLVLQINGRPYAEKPPLFFYLAALGDCLSQSNGGRIVEALAFAGILWLLFRLSKKTGRSPPWFAPCIFLTFGMSFVMGKFGIIDALLVFFMMLAIAAGHRALVSPRPILPWIGCHAALALGGLTKGPVLLPFVIIPLACLAWTERSERPARARLHWIGHALGLLVLLAMVLAWLIPLYHLADKAYTHALLGQVGGRISGSRGSHNQPWFYYADKLLFLCLPWTGILILGVKHAWRRKRQYLWLLAWFLGGLLILSLFQSKRERYLLLILPAAAMLAAAYLARPDWQRLDRWVLRFTSGLLFLSGAMVLPAGPVMAGLKTWAPDALPGATADFIAHVSWQAGLFVWPLCGAVVLAGARQSWQATTAQRMDRFAAGILWGIIGLSLTFDLGVAPALNPIKSGAAFTRALQAYADKPMAIHLYHNDFDGRLNRPLNRNAIPVLASAKDLLEAEACLAADGPAAVIFGLRDKHTPSPDYVPPVKGGVVLARGRIGGRIMIMLGNAEAAALIPPANKPDP